MVRGISPSGRRLMELSLDTAPRPTTTVVAYAPHNGHAEEERESFMEALEESVARRALGGPC